MEKKEREERRRNIVVKRIRDKKEKIKGEVGKLLREMEVEGHLSLEEVKKIGVSSKINAGMVMARMANMEMKREVMIKKKRLKGREEIIFNGNRNFIFIGNVIR